MHSIRFKITAITVAAILTTILSVFAASYTSVQLESEQRSVQMMNLLCRDTQKSLEKYFEGVERSVEMAANIAGDTLDSVALVECGAAGARAGETVRSAEQAARLDAYLAAYCAQVQEAFSSVASHTHGIVSYYYCLSPALSEKEHGFCYSRVGKTGFDKMEAIDASACSDEVWYATPIQKGRPCWVGPYPSDAFRGPEMCSYVVPIYRAGATVGVIGMDILLETLIEQVTPIRVYRSGYACLFDENGGVIYHPGLAYGSPAQALGLDIGPEAFEQSSSGEELIRYTRQGEERQLAFSTLPNGMKLVITAPVSEINEAMIRLSHVLLLVTAASVLVFTALVLFVMRLITRPLKRLTDASQRLAAKDYDVELSYHSRDEIGVLTDSFRQMRDQIRSYIDDLNRRINTDSLTGLPNMRCFFRLSEQERSAVVEGGGRPVMLYLNLIGMKHFNRQYGFDEGDALLRDMAAILRRRYGERRTCRFSEDHFAVLTEEEGLERRLRELLEECRAANGGRSLPVRIGVYPDSIERVSVSIACDRAKYACDLHRGSYVSGYQIFDNTMLRQVENQRYIISHLDQALREKWILVCYQPIVRASSGHVSDEEALSRWVDPERGRLAPDEFIPVLEKARLIYKLDLYVLDEILEKMKAQKKAGLRIVPHSLNLSRVDFDACDIVGEICRRVDEAGIARDRLTIEVTESMIGRDFEFMKAQVLRFRDCGFRVWMDDFGSGYSALDVLQEIPFDLIKFDMRFLERFEDSGKCRTILTALVGMARGLNVETVCEGVETGVQAAFLREIGCTKLQGYYFSKPVPFAGTLERYQKEIQIGYEPTDGE